MKKRFDELIADVEPMEIVTMEEQLIKEGMSTEDVKQLSDLHVTLFKGMLDERDIPNVPDGHPIHTFLRENKVFTNAVADVNLLLQQLRIDNTLRRTTSFFPSPLKHSKSWNGSISERAKMILDMHLANHQWIGQMQRAVQQMQRMKIRLKGMLTSGFS